jgi:hypothetical protein
MICARALARARSHLVMRMARVAASGGVIRRERSDDLDRPVLDVGPVTVIAVAAARRAEEDPPDSVPMPLLDHACEEPVGSAECCNVGRYLPGTTRQPRPPGPEKARRLPHGTNAEEPHWPPRLAAERRQQRGRGRQPSTVVNRAPDHRRVVSTVVLDIVGGAQINVYTCRRQLVCDCSSIGATTRCPSGRQRDAAQPGSWSLRHAKRRW